MKKSLLALAISGMAFVGNQAFAIQPYITGQVGQSNIDAGDGVYADSLDDDDTYYGLGVGVRINQNLGFEIGYHDYGKIDVDYGSVNPANPNEYEDATESLELDSISIAAVGTIPLDPSFSIFGKVGLDLWDAKWKDDYTLVLMEGTSHVSDSVSDDGADLFLALGASFDITEAAKLFLEYQMHSFDVKGRAYESVEGYDDVDLEVDTDVLSIGATFSF